MRRVSIAIISKRREIIRFFELEALSFGFSVSVFERMPAESGAFDLIIADSLCVRQSSVISDRIMLISDELYAQEDENRRLSYPMPIGKLREIYEQLAYGKSIAPQTWTVDRSDVSESKIIFYREIENTVGYLGRSISLSDHEIKILQRLCQSNGEAVSREELNLLLGAESGNIADVYICRLRKKLEESDRRRVIFTERSKGYRTSLAMEWK